VTSLTGERAAQRLEWEEDCEGMELGDACRLLMVAAPALAGGLSLERPSREVAVWVTYWDLKAGISRIVEEGGSRRVEVNDAFLFAAALTPDGGVRLVGDEGPVVSAAADLESRGARVWLTFVNDVHPAEAGAPPTLKDAAIVHGLLADGERSERHQRDILALAQRLRVSGIDIDYENLAFEDRAAFTRFVAELSLRTRREGLSLSITAQPKTGDVYWAGAGAIDWSAICPFVDRLHIMLYNLHSSVTGPGPIATPEWMERVLAFATGECPVSRVVPAIKLSGMDWGSGGAKGIQYDQSVALAARVHSPIARDPSGAPYFYYDATDGRHTVFFEDADSIEDKLRTIERLGFDRVILWSVGREDPALLPRLRGGS
jgi:spore germination protein YaaH